MVSSDILIGVAKEFNVSMDYILDLSEGSREKVCDGGGSSLLQLQRQQDRGCLRYGYG